MQGRLARQVPKSAICVSRLTIFDAKMHGPTVPIPVAIVFHVCYFNRNWPRYIHGQRLLGEGEKIGGG